MKRDSYVWGLMDITHSQLLGQPVTIFLIDDDDVDVKAVARALKKLKVQNSMVRAKDGVEALSMLRCEGKIPRPFLILLDINMPRMNGIEFLEEIRCDQKLSSSIVFVLTTSQDDRDKTAAYSKHVAGYMVKNHIDNGFTKAIELLDHYWKVVEIPMEKA